MAVPRKLSSTDTRYVSAAVRANRVVEPDTTAAADSDGFRKVKEAASGSTKFLGVAMVAASPEALPSQTFTKPRNKTTIAGAPVTERVEFAAAAADGEPLVCAADGKVTPGTTANGVVGWAVGDVPAAGVGFIKLAR